VPSKVCHEIQSYIAVFGQSQTPSFHLIKIGASDITLNIINCWGETPYQNMIILRFFKDKLHFLVDFAVRLEGDELHSGYSVFLYVILSETNF
jgi:hypothetical protein